MCSLSYQECRKIWGDNFTSPNMPAPTNDPISSVLQRTFGGLEQKKEGLIRGGNSASAKSFNVLDKKLQATSKSSTTSGIHIQFDEPTQYSSGSGIRQQMNGGNANGTGSSTPKVIVLNPQFLPKKTENNASERNGSSQNEPSKLPKPKVRTSKKWYHVGATAIFFVNFRSFFTPCQEWTLATPKCVLLEPEWPTSATLVTWTVLCKLCSIPPLYTITSWIIVEVTTWANVHHHRLPTDSFRAVQFVHWSILCVIPYGTMLFDLIGYMKSWK